MLREEQLKERSARSLCYDIHIASRYLLLICIARIEDKLTTTPAFLQQIPINDLLRTIAIKTEVRKLQTSVLVLCFSPISA